MNENQKSSVLEVNEENNPINVIENNKWLLKFLKKTLPTYKNTSIILFSINITLLIFYHQFVTYEHFDYLICLFLFSGAIIFFINNVYIFHGLIEKIYFILNISKENCLNSFIGEKKIFKDGKYKRNYLFKRKKIRDFDDFEKIENYMEDIRKTYSSIRIYTNFGIICMLLSIISILRFINKWLYYIFFFIFFVLILNILIRINKNKNLYLKTKV